MRSFIRISICIIIAFSANVESIYSSTLGIGSEQSRGEWTQDRAIHPLATGAANMTSLSESLFDIASGALSFGLQKLGMREQNANITAGAIVIVGSIFAIRKLPELPTLKSALNPVQIEKGTANKAVAQIEKSVFTVTKEGVVLPKGAKIPNQFIENKFRSADFGEMINGKFQSRVRIDTKTPIGMKGPNQSHFHLNNGEHIFDANKWPWW
jgi:hypothetical protein